MNNYKIIIAPNTDYYKSIEYCFGKNNIVTLKPDEKIKKIREKAKNISTAESIIFYRLIGVNDIIFNMLPRKIKKYVIFPYSITELSDPVKMNELLLILRYKNMNFIEDVYCLENTTYKLFKEKYDFKFLQLDMEISEENNNQDSSSIGVITNYNNYYDTIMNELSAITLTVNNYVRIHKPIKSVKSFCKRFKIKIIPEKSPSQAIKNNNINLYINFTDTCYTYILESMDQGIPCIVGNTDFFDSNEYLKKHLVVNSDDDIDEMKEKIEFAIKNKKQIIKNYQEFRKKYKKNAQENLKKLKEKL